jgi:hypothetical protein
VDPLGQILSKETPEIRRRQLDSCDRAMVTDSDLTETGVPKDLFGLVDL